MYLRSDFSSYWMISPLDSLRTLVPTITCLFWHTCSCRLLVSLNFGSASIWNFIRMAVSITTRVNDVCLTLSKRSSYMARCFRVYSERFSIAFNASCKSAGPKGGSPTGGTGNTMLFEMLVIFCRCLGSCSWMKSSSGANGLMIESSSRADGQLD